MALIQPTFVHNKTYDGLKDSDSRMFAIDCPKEEVEEYKELMAKTCAIHLKAKFSVNIKGMSDQEALNEVMQMLKTTPDSSKPSDFPVLFPANNVPEQRQKLSVLVSTGKSKEALRVQLSHEQLKRLLDKEVEKIYKCDPPQDFNAKGESTRTTRFHFKTKELILTHCSTLAILPH